MYELLVKSGTVIDPAQGIHDQRDIGISQGKIAALTGDIAPSEAKKVIDARGKIVTPGLIDIHAHVAGGIVNMASTPDECGVLSGVTTVSDPGAIGYANFADFRKFIIPQARTDIFCFLHMCSTGFAVLPEIYSWDNIDPEAILRTIEKNRDIIKGIKIRAIGALMQNLGLEAIRVTKKVATEAGLPIMIHLGIDAGETVPEDIISAFMSEMLSLLDKGDILTHFFTWKAGGVIKPDGSVLPELKEAIRRGVALDATHVGTMWNFEVVKKGLEQGMLPTTISTDLTSLTPDLGPLLGLTSAMSRFFIAGLTLDQVIEMTTINPARVLGEEPRRGSLGKGMPADVSILELTEGDFSFFEGITDKAVKGNRQLVPKLTIKSGVEIEAQPRFK